MCQEVRVGGKGVPDVPLKLDVLFFSFLCNSVRDSTSHRFHLLLLFWFLFPLRRLVVWNNMRPKGEVLPQHYKQVVNWAKRHKECQEGTLCLDHRSLYKALVEKQGPVGVYGVGPEGWGFIQQKGLPNRLRDINWLCLHRRMPVREVLHRHGLSRVRSCPRAGCVSDETIDHVFWGCKFARGVWGELEMFFPRLGFLSYDMLMLGLGLRERGREGFLLWLVLSVGKAALWDARAVLIKSNVNWRVGGVVAKIREEVVQMRRMEEDKYGYHAARERWKTLFF